MARLVGMILSHDDSFHAQLGALLRGGPVPMSVVAEGPGTRKADLFIIDARGDIAGAMARVEALRAASATSGIFVVASEPSVCGENVGAHVVGKWRGADERLNGIGGSPKLLGIIHVECRQLLTNACADTSRFGEAPIRIDGDDESRGHGEAGARHLAEVCALATDERDVGAGDRLEPANVAGGIATAR